MKNMKDKKCINLKCMIVGGLKEPHAKRITLWPPILVCNLWALFKCFKYLQKSSGSLEVIESVWSTYSECTANWLAVAPEHFFMVLLSRSSHGCDSDIGKNRAWPPHQALDLEHNLWVNHRFLSREVAYSTSSTNAHPSQILYGSDHFILSRVVWKMLFIWSQVHTEIAWMTIWPFTNGYSILDR